MEGSSMIARLRGTWQRMRDNHAAMAELAACPAGELHRIAKEVGVGDADLRSLLCSHPGPRDLMPRRLEQLGLDSAFLKVEQPATYRDMERVCGSCRAWRRCAHDLARGDVQAGMSGYCLNAATIDALTVDGFEPRA
jgi:hypothetical protein